MALHGVLARNPWLYLTGIGPVLGGLPFQGRSVPAQLQSTRRIHGCARLLNTVDPCLDLCAVKDR